MYLFDTDTLSNFLDANRSYEQLRTRLVDTPPEQRFISIVNVEELLQGQAASINTLRGKGNEARLTDAYALYHHLYEALRLFQVVPYDRAAAEIYLGLDAAKRREGKSDARIAACAASRGLIVVTCNLAHFEKIGLAPCEDWTRGSLP